MKLPITVVKKTVNEYKHLLSLFSGHLNSYTELLGKKKPEELYAPSAYIISLGGKRLRPLLALVSCDLFDADPVKALDSALAVELFHNFSLIHDDILDEAPLRRNQVTVHEKWNRNIAILSGDALLVKSLMVLQSYPAEEMKRLSETLTLTALEVCEGQQQDMNFETQHKVSIAEYIEMIKFKTAVLLGCSLKMGAINAGADTQQQKHLYDFGENLGIAFQLMDDYLDAFSEDQHKFGKRVGGDILANKKTFLLLKSFELADKNQTGQLENLIQNTHHDDEFKVKEMLNLYSKLGVGNFCKTEADRFTALALNALDKLSANTEKKRVLRNFSIELLNRQV